MVNRKEPCYIWSPTCKSYEVLCSFDRDADLGSSEVDMIQITRYMYFLSILVAKLRVGPVCVFLYFLRIDTPSLNATASDCVLLILVRDVHPA